MDEFDNYCINIDADCITQDFDDYDLYGEKTIESNNNYGNDIIFE